MKKSYLLTIAILLIATLTITLCACGEKESELESDTLMGTADQNQHLAATEKTEETKEETEKPTEKPTEEVTETETEPPVTFVEESLRFLSYGNGTCAVSGIGSCTDLFIVIPERSPDGDIVTAIEDRAFYNNADIKAIEIPSTISSIGSMAFGGCESLVYISVDKNNKAFTDIGGVLYTKDGTTLLSFPSAGGATTVEISKAVTSIADMAFYGCDDLREIHYGGTLSDWGKILIGETNYGLYTASLSCSGGK